MNVIKRSEEEFHILNNKINQYEKNKNIDNIIIITHTCLIKNSAMIKK